MPVQPTAIWSGDSQYIPPGRWVYVQCKFVGQQSPYHNEVAEMMRAITGLHAIDPTEYLGGAAQSALFKTAVLDDWFSHDDDGMSLILLGKIDVSFDGADNLTPDALRDHVFGGTHHKPEPNVNQQVGVVAYSDQWLDSHQPELDQLSATQADPNLDLGTGIDKAADSVGGFFKTISGAARERWPLIVFAGIACAALGIVAVSR